MLDTHTPNKFLPDDAWDQTTGMIRVPSGVLHPWPLTTYCLSLTASMLCVVVTKDGRKKKEKTCLLLLENKESARFLLQMLL